MRHRSQTCLSRRHVLGSGVMGLGGLALASLLRQEQAHAAPQQPLLNPVEYDLTPKAPPMEPRADAMISLFMGGGPSHIDLFDPKPLLEKYDGKIYPDNDIVYDNAGGASKVVMASPFRFRKCGESGIELSELIPHIQGIADEMTLIRSMNLDGIRNHVAGMQAFASGRERGRGRPTVGSWLTYGLGAESQDLPAYVVMNEGGNIPGSPFWSSGFLPSVYEGTLLRNEEPRILNLDPPEHLRGIPQRNNLDLLKRLNEIHLERMPGETVLEGRIASFKLAARMQSSASEAFDVSGETRAIQRLYGMEAEDKYTRRYGKACLVARRLIERGVRFVQIWRYSWDAHSNINEELPMRCRWVDQPSAALVKDLKQRGLLDRTLVHWGGEMGRLPVIQYGGPESRPGRDHNPFGFSMWLAGGGVKQGHIHGATDDFGLNAVEGKVHHYDYHATLLRLFGFGESDLRFLRAGREESLLDGQPGRAVEEIIA